MATSARDGKRFVIDDDEFEPAYMSLFRTGILFKRIESAIEELGDCEICPRLCRVNRLDDKTATCKIGRHARVASFHAHFGEEDCLRGWKGSGTIFFSGCNLRCVFCQNYDISQQNVGMIVDKNQLASMMLRIQESGCHNINLVTPEHVVPQILEALPIAIENGLRLPIVYNTSAYDSQLSLRHLDGVVDIYMPDLKFWDSDLSLKYLKAKDYPQVAIAAIKEMYRQVGDLMVNMEGLAIRGLLVRHLVMPGFIRDTENIMAFLGDEISPNTYVNIMPQYYPAWKVGSGKYSEINRRIMSSEYQDAISAARNAGLWRFDQRRLGTYLQWQK